MTQIAMALVVMVVKAFHFLIPGDGLQVLNVEQTLTVIALLMHLQM